MRLQVVAAVVGGLPAGMGTVVFMASAGKGRRMLPPMMGHATWRAMLRERLPGSGVPLVAVLDCCTPGGAGTAMSGEEQQQWARARMAEGKKPVIVAPARGGLAEGLNPDVGVMAAVILLGVPLPYVASPRLKAIQRRRNGGRLVEVDMDAGSVVVQAVGRAIRSAMHRALVVLCGDFSGTVKGYLGYLQPHCDKPATPVEQLRSITEDFIALGSNSGRERPAITVSDDTPSSSSDSEFELDEGNTAAGASSSRFGAASPPSGGRRLQEEAPQQAPPDSAGADGAGGERHGAGDGASEAAAGGMARLADAVASAALCGDFEAVRSGRTQRGSRGGGRHAERGLGTTPPSPARRPAQIAGFHPPPCRPAAPARAGPARVARCCEPGAGGSRSSGGNQRVRRR